MLWAVYNTLFAIGYFLMLPRFVLRMWKRGGYRKGFLQRLGVVGPEVVSRLRDGERVWIHAVSVGEVFVASKFIEALKKSEPAMRFVLSTTTSTGHSMAERTLDAGDVLLYFPCDFPIVVKRMLDLVRPRALILTECELWPNIIRQARSRGIPVILINGRISDSSHRGYRKIRLFLRPVLEAMNLCLVQTEEDLERLVTLGARRDSVRALGSAKYDVAEPGDSSARAAEGVLRSLGIGSDSLVLVGGSTWPGEEKVLLDILVELKRSFEKLRLVLVPRHAERRAEVASQIAECGLKYALRSRADAWSSGNEAPDVVLIDTTGELPGFYACATIVFVGKSLTRHGGQNVIEAALLGKPVLVGPNMENFPVVVEDFLSSDAILRVSDAAELGQRIRALLADKVARDAYGRRAADVVREHQGVVESSTRLILDSLARSSAGPPGDGR